MKNKNFLLACLVFLLVFAVVSAPWTFPSHDAAHYYHQINTLIKDCDFYRAELDHGRIFLYDRDGLQVGEVPFAAYEGKKGIKYIRKEGEVIYFVTGVAVDDESGVMFVNDGSDSMMDGIASVERIGGNAYEYSTMMKNIQ